MRRALFIVFLTWIPAVYYIATRFTSPVTAGLVTLLAVTWSLPIYSEPIASWYNLFLATHGAASLLRYLETGRRRWLFAAGVCGGLSLVSKIIGVYFLIASCLSLLFYEQSRGRKPSVINHRPAGSSLFSLFSILYRAALIVGMSAGVALLWRVVLTANGPSGVVHFALPVGGLAAVLIHGELAQTGGSPISRLRDQWRMLLPMMMGVLLVVVPFLMPYVFSGSFGDLIQGLFVSPLRRFGVTANPPPALSSGCASGDFDSRENLALAVAPGLRPLGFPDPPGGLLRVAWRQHTLLSGGNALPYARLFQLPSWPDACCWCLAAGTRKGSRGRSRFHVERELQACLYPAVTALVEPCATARRPWYSRCWLLPGYATWCSFQ